MKMTRAAKIESRLQLLCYGSMFHLVFLQIPARWILAANMHFKTFRAFFMKKGVYLPYSQFEACFVFPPTP